MLVTSPPYVTSYEYADLHQLSSIWLGYAKDFRELREKSIGSTFRISQDFTEYLNPIGKEIISKLKKYNKRGQFKSVAKYFYDMKCVIKKIDNVLKSGGIGVIVIGNTEYSGVKIDNAKYLSYELFMHKMKNIEVYKREIGTKILTRHRDIKGRFTNRKKSKNVYHYEFLVNISNTLTVIPTLFNTY